MSYSMAIKLCYGIDFGKQDEPLEERIYGLPKKLRDQLVVVNHGCGLSGPTCDVLAVKASIQHGSDSGCVIVRDVFGDAWAGVLAEACEALGLPYSEPKRMLCAYYS